MKITVFPDTGDVRGLSHVCKRRDFSFPNPLEEAHVSTILPGKIRGNHFHEERRELIFAIFFDGCLVAWDEGEGTPVKTRQFAGKGSFAIEVTPHHSHAIKNTGKAEMMAVALSDHDYSPESPDTVTRVVLE